MITRRRYGSVPGLAELAVLTTLAAGTACGGKHTPLAAPARTLTPPTHLCGADEKPPQCRAALDIEDLLRADTEILGMADTPSGMQGAKILTLEGHAHGETTVLRVKWRAQSSGDLINEPRKELAAYAVQKLFLGQSELVVPPTVAHCFPLSMYRRFAPGEAASFESLDCVLGFASYWLEGVKTVKAARTDKELAGGTGIFDAKEFKDDLVYRSSLSNCNLLTNIINHGDAHDEQFVLEQTAGGLRAYVVDNSIAFRSIKNPALIFRQDWSDIQVPTLPAGALERMRKLTDADYAELGRIAVLERAGRQLVQAEANRGTDASDGTTMSWNGPRLRIGLTAGEIALVKSRIEHLLAWAAPKHE